MGSRLGTAWVLAITLYATPVGLGASQVSVGEEPPRWGPVTPECEVGEPVDWVLEIVHPRRARPDIMSEELSETLDASWAFLSGPVIQTRPEGADDGAYDRERSTFTWRLMALESGERTAPSLILLGEAGAQLEVLSDPLVVKPALADGEDAARPFASFHEIEGGTVGSLTRLFGILLGGLVLVLLGIVWLVRRSRRGRDAGLPPIPISPRAAFDAAVAGRRDDAEGVQSLAFEMSRILRLALDVGEAGSTDAEWLEALRGANRLGPDAMLQAEAVLSACEQIKYGGHVPTRFAIDELLGNVDRILKDVDRTESAATSLEAVG